MYSILLFYLFFSFPTSPFFFPFIHFLIAKYSYRITINRWVGNEASVNEKRNKIDECSVTKPEGNNKLENTKALMGGY
jgi:hypothetical protein